MVVSETTARKMPEGAEQTAFDAVYRDYYPHVHGFVFQMLQNTSLADELTQDAFVKALEAWRDYRGEAPVRIWLLRIARNTVLDYFRSPRSKARGLASLDEAIEVGREPSEQVTGRGVNERSVEETARRREMSECVQRFVLDLPEILRTPLILHDLQGLKNREIAQVLGCSIEAAKMRLHRARARMKGMMEDNCELFRDEEDVLSCLPNAPDRTRAAAQ